MVIGTRSDCIDKEKLAYFADIAKTHYVIIEYGIESVYDQTLKRINRGHDFQNVVDALELTASYRLHTGGHMIWGLPGESQQMMMDSVHVLNKLPLTTIKFHQLQIVKGTALGKEYQENPEAFYLPNLDEYINFITHFVSRLNPTFVIERFAGEVPPNYLIASGWQGKRYDQVLNLILKKMKESDLWQGKLFN